MPVAGRNDPAAVQRCACDVSLRSARLIATVHLNRIRPIAVRIDRERRPREIRRPAIRAGVPIVMVNVENAHGVAARRPRRVDPHRERDPVVDALKHVPAALPGEAGPMRLPPARKIVPVAVKNRFLRAIARVCNARKRVVAARADDPRFREILNGPGRIPRIRHLHEHCVPGRRRPRLLCPCNIGIDPINDARIARSRRTDGNGIVCRALHVNWGNRPNTGCSQIGANNNVVGDV